MNGIPLVDLKAQYRAIKQEIDDAMRGVVENTAFIMGDGVKKFEEAFARYCGAKHAVACSSGTTALHLALMACGVKQGDEVIVPSHTFIATAEAVCHCGAIPVFVDIDPATYNMDPTLVEKALTPKTKAIIPVHIYGQSCEMNRIMDIARSRGLKVVEDCAQSHGAKYDGQTTGTIGDCGAFSFFPGKNLGAYGDAGMVVTADDAMAEKMALLVNHGRQKKYEHDLVGYNYRMDALQAAILDVKLRYLSAWSASRIRIAHRYNELLMGLPLSVPEERFGHAYHLYVVQCDDREALAASLKADGIATGVHYPIPLHMQPCFGSLRNSGRGHLAVSERVADRILSLPIYPELTDDQQDAVVASIRRHYTA